MTKWLVGIGAALAAAAGASLVTQGVLPQECAKVTESLFQVVLRLFGL